MDQLLIFLIPIQFIDTIYNPINKKDFQNIVQYGNWWKNPENSFKLIADYNSFTKFALSIERGVAQLASVLAWGASGRPFESDHPDQERDYPDKKG